MKNLKRSLALVLSVIMLVGMMAIGAGAAFTDDAEIEYTEAAAVMNAIGIIKGYPDGSFGPDATLTRAEAAVMIARLLGFDDAKGSCTFTDVKGNAAYAWAEGPIALCEVEGIVAGNGDGTFGPDDKLTGYAWAKMLLCAMGYNAAAEGMVGGTWDNGVYKLVKSTGLAAGIAGFDGAAEISREAAAQMAYTAAGKATVKWIAGTTISGTGLTIDVGGHYDTAYAGTTLFAQLGYTRTETYDDFGAPEVVWTNAKSEEVLVLPGKALVTYTEQKTDKEVFADVKGYKYIDDNGTPADDTDDFAAEYTEAKAKALIADLTGDGTLVAVYADAKKVLEVVQVEYALGTIADVKEDKANGGTYYQIGANKYYDYTDPKTADTVAFAEAPAKNDVVTYVVKAGVCHIYPTTSFDGKVTALSSKKVATINGTGYEGNDVIYGDMTFIAAERTYIVDQYGYIVDDIDVKGAAASTDYAYILDAALIEGQGGIETSADVYEVRALLADGTVGIYNVAVQTISGVKKITANIALPADEAALETALEGKVFGYTLNGTALTLEDIAASGANKGDVFASAVTVAKGVTSYNDVIFAAGTKFVYVNTKNDKFVVTTFDGVSKLPTYDAGDIADTQAVSAITTAPRSVASVVFVVVTDAAETEVKDYAYFDGSEYEQLGASKYTFVAVDKNGAEVTLTHTGIPAKGMYQYNEDLTVKALIVATTGKLVLQADAVVEGDYVLVGSDWVDMSAATVQFFNKTDKLAGNDAWIVLNAAGNAVTNIFVIG